MRHGKTKTELLNSLREGAGSQFDPDLVEILCEILEKTPERVGVSYDENEKITYKAPTVREALKENEQKRNSRNKDNNDRII